MLSCLWWLIFAVMTIGLHAMANNNDFSTLGSDELTPDPDYYELRKYASLSSVAYCLSIGLSLGRIGDQTNNCTSSACKKDYIKDLEIKKMFNFDNFLEVGHGFIAVDSTLKTIYVAFKGTSSYTDWFNNLDIINTGYTPQVIQSEDFEVSGMCCVNCRVHRGFASFDKLRGPTLVDLIIEVVDDHPDYKIKLTGHSLGAALALLTGIELRLLGYNALVVTLGSPKIGNRQFTNFVDQIFETKNVMEHIEEHKSFEELDNGYIRMLHRHDLVPFLPPTSKYAHAGYEYYLSVEGVKQTPFTIFRRGKSYLENEKFDYLETIKNFRRIDHSSYFMPVTTCSHVDNELTLSDFQ